jgi:plastocyanin
MRRSALLPVLLLVPALAACGGGSDGGSSGGGGSGKTELASSCPADAVTIHMKDIKFHPAKATAKAGQKICWINDEDIQHDAEAKSGADFKSPLYGKGQAYVTTVSTPGTVEYVCSVHPGMDGTLDITP